MFDYNDTLQKLKVSIDEYNKVVWDWLPEGTDRRMPEMEFTDGIPEDYYSSLHHVFLDFRDTFHPFQLSEKSLEACMLKALHYLKTFTDYLRNKKIETWYVVTPYQKQSFLSSFSFENFRKWKSEENYYYAYPSKEEAENYCK
jgi:hypothetical protein